MAERRRIIPATVGPLFKDQKDLKTPPAVRLQLDLSATTEEICPEFAYPDLVKNVLGPDHINGKGSESKSFNDIHEEDLASLEEIARKFEEKYNAPGKKGKKKRLVLEDLIDAGMGYDETDPFVDNSECYDELVPASLTTQFGGFYINSGPLKFKEIIDSDDGDFHRIKSPKKKKKLRLENGDGTEKKIKRKLSSDSGGTGDHLSKKARKQLKKKLREEKKLKKKKGPHMIRTPTVAELLKRNAAGSPSSPQLSTSTQNGPVTSASVSAPTPSSKPQNGTTPQVSSTGAGQGVDMSLDLGIQVDDLNMDKALMDVMASMNGGENLGDGTAGVGGGGDVDSDVNVSPSAPGAGGEEGGSKEIVDLPLGLPPLLIEHIEKIKEAARKSVEGKAKFFNAYVNGLLLKIEHGTRTLNCNKRSAVYSHLANHLPCTKLTLQKRAKKLQLGAQDNQLKEPLLRLREAITQVMAEEELRYKAECAEAAMKADLEPTLDSEGKIVEHKPPKKRFNFDDRLRKLLCDVVKVKVKTFEISKSRTQSAEEYLKAFLESEVKPLWPKDWMQTRNLFKESRTVHDHLTSLATKQRKALQGGPRKLVLAGKKEGDGEGPSTNHAGSAGTPEGEPSSTQINDMVGSPITAKHLADVPTLLDYVGSGDESMDAAITSSQNKPMELSSDSNISPADATAQNMAQDIRMSSTSPLPNLDPNFLVDQLISQQLVTNSLDGGGLTGRAQSTTPGTSFGQNTGNRTGGMGMVNMQKAGKTEGMTSGNAFANQMGDFDSNQQSYSAKLSAMSNMHTMRTMQTQKPGVQAKDVTSSSGVMTGVNRAGGGQKKGTQQAVIRLTRDNTIEKMTSQAATRVRVQSSQQKGLVSSSVTNTQGQQGTAQHMTYSQPSNTPVQGRSNVASQRMMVGSAMDMLSQVCSQSVPASASAQQISPSQTTSHQSTYVRPTVSPQHKANMHNPGSSYSPTQQMHRVQGQSPTSRPQQTSPHKYSPNSQQQYAIHQQYSPGAATGHTSPIAAAYSTSPSYQAMGGASYQRQGSGGANYGTSYPMNQGQVQGTAQGNASQSSDAVITGPAAGTYFQASDPRF